MQRWKELTLVDKIVLVVGLFLILYFTPGVLEFLSHLLSYLAGILDLRQ